MLLALAVAIISDDLRKLDDDNVYRKLQGHWIIEMSEMIATANAKSIQEIKSFLSRQQEVYNIPYDTHPEDRLRQCVFGGTSNALHFLPLDRSGNRRFLPVMVYPAPLYYFLLAGIPHSAPQARGNTGRLSFRPAVGQAVPAALVSPLTPFPVSYTHLPPRKRC